jgi:2-polyprenyl-6-methoxyphenol hydroxylase-like FAD-dependent oxidoreductase
VVIEARLVVAADGVQSAVRNAFGVAAETRDYEQTAIITTVLPQRSMNMSPTSGSPRAARSLCCPSKAGAAPWC